MLNMEQWMTCYEEAVIRMFGSDRVAFIGLQGSRGRGEATETSDIDVVLVLDRVTLEDLKQYREGLQALPQNELICGFVSGVEELRGWDSADRFQFYFDTTAWRGRLDEIIPVPGAEDGERAMRMGCCNIYHGCVHNYVHERSPELLNGLYKNLRFILQAKYYCETGCYYKTRAELERSLSEGDRVLWRYCLARTAAENFEEQSRALLDWCGEAIGRFAENR